MRTRKWIGVGGCAAVVVVVLTFAGIGTAASPGVCNTSGPSCVSEFVAPHFLTASDALAPATWNEAVATTRFTNQSGIGGATATHTVLSVTFAALAPVQWPFVTVNETRAVLANGTPVTAACETTATNDPTQAGYTATQLSKITRSCSVGNISGGTTIKLLVRFATDTSMNTDSTHIVGNVIYGESGNDNPGGPNGAVNDTHSAADTLTVGGNVQGDCFDLSDTTPTATVSGTTITQMTTATIGKPADAALPCAPASAGVDTTVAHRPPQFTRDVSFTEFLPIAGGSTGTVLVDFLTALPKGFVLQELVNFDHPELLTSWAPVLKCGVVTTLDSCIAGTKNLPKGGFRYIVSAFGSGADPRYSG